MPRKKKVTSPTEESATTLPAETPSGETVPTGQEMVDLSIYLDEISSRLVTAETIPEPASAGDGDEAVEHRQLIIFRLGTVAYGIEISHVVEVMQNPEITLVPGLPGWVLGVCNVHGEILSVVDLARFLENPPVANWRPEYMLVTQAQNQRIGLAVDDVDIIYTVPLNQVISPPFKIEPVLVDYLQGAVERSEGFIRLLDCERLLLGQQMQQFS